MIQVAPASNDPFASLDTLPLPSAVPITALRADAKTADALRAVIDVPAKPELSFFSHRSEPTDADIGWAAGVLDGEGCVQIARQRYPESSPRQDTFQLRIQIAQASVGVLKEFEWVVGLHGKLHSPKPKALQTRVCHYLNYSGLRAFYVLERLREHLRRKTRHAELARQYRDDCQIHLHPGPKGTPEEVWTLRRWYWERMRVLNREA